MSLMVLSEINKFNTLYRIGLLIWQLLLHLNSLATVNHPWIKAELPSIVQ